MSQIHLTGPKNILILRYFNTGCLSCLKSKTVLFLSLISLNNSLVLLQRDTKDNGLHLTCDGFFFRNMTDFEVLTSLSAGHGGVQAKGDLSNQEARSDVWLLPEGGAWGAGSPHPLPGNGRSG